MDFSFELKINALILLRRIHIAITKTICDCRGETKYNNNKIKIYICVYFFLRIAVGKYRLSEIEGEQKKKI